MSIFPLNPLIIILTEILSTVILGFGGHYVIDLFQGTITVLYLFILGIAMSAIFIIDLLQNRFRDTLMS